MRSFLFVPGDSLRKFESAKKTAADALILDLEDSIAPEEKVGARRTVREMLDARNPAQRNYIRVNALDTGMSIQSPDATTRAKLTEYLGGIIAAQRELSFHPEFGLLRASGASFCPSP